MRASKWGSGTDATETKPPAPFATTTTSESPAQRRSLAAKSSRFGNAMSFLKTRFGSKRDVAVAPDAAKGLRNNAATLAVSGAMAMWDRQQFRAKVWHLTVPLPRLWRAVEGGIQLTECLSARSSAPAGRTSRRPKSKRTGLC